MENHGDTNVFSFENLRKDVFFAHDGIRFETFVHSKDYHVCKLYFRKGFQNKQVVLELPKVSHPRKTKSESLESGLRDYNGVIKLARDEQLVRLDKGKSSQTPIKRVLIIFPDSLSNAVFGLSHDATVPREFCYVDSEYTVLDQHGRSDCVVVAWSVVIASRMNRQIKPDENVRTDEENLAEQMRKKCSIPFSMDIQHERELALMKELAEAREQIQGVRVDAKRNAEASVTKQYEEFLRLQEKLQQQLADAERRAEEAAEATEQVKREQKLQFQTMQRELAEKERAFQSRADHMEQQASLLGQYKQQQDSEAQFIRNDAKRLVDEANRRELDAALAAAVAVATASSVEPPVAIHPKTKKPLQGAEVRELVMEFANKKDSSFDEVMEWIGTLNPTNEQAVVNILFSEYQRELES